jgi:prepilin-type N-terminal cleavage/methylation domain-containing protein
VRRKRRPAFTLLELTLVLALIVVLLALAVPSLMGLYGEVKTDAAVDAFRAALVAARARAIEDGRPYSVAVLPGTGHYRIAPDSPSYWPGSGDSQPASLGPAPLVLTSLLPDRVQFAIDGSRAQDETSTTGELPNNTDSVDSGQWTRQSIVATFLPDGTALSDCKVTFHLAGSRPQVVRMRALTGSVSAGYLDTGSGQP